VIETRTCTTPSERFIEEPYNFAWGSSIYVRILATNIKGSSAYSLSGNGGIILRIPDVPINLADLPDITNAN
jgi:hypothetical protein